MAFVIDHRFRYLLLDRDRSGRHRRTASLVLAPRQFRRIGQPSARSQPRASQQSTRCQRQRSRYEPKCSKMSNPTKFFKLFLWMKQTGSQLRNNLVSKIPASLTDPMPRGCHGTACSILWENVVPFNVQSVSMSIACSSCWGLLFHCFNHQNNKIPKICFNVSVCLELSYQMRRKSTKHISTRLLLGAQFYPSSVCYLTPATVC